MRTQFSGREVATVLVNAWNFEPVSRSGDHLTLRYEHPETGEVRRTTVPLAHDPVREGTLRSIAEDCGANSFREFCAELDRCL